MSLPIMAVRWIEWIDKKQPQILPLRIRMTARLGGRVTLWGDD